MTTKTAQGDTLPVTPPPAGSTPIPEVQVTPQPVAGKKGPVGTAPRTNYSRVNSVAPPAPDAGATEAKTLQPKYGSIMNHASHMSLQGMLKAAQAGSLSRAKLAEEASKQSESEKDKDEKCSKCGKVKCSCGDKTASVSSDYLHKIADALEFVGEELGKEADGATKLGPGAGPNHLEVSQATATTPLPDHKGQASPKNIVPMHPGEEKGKPTGPHNAMATNDKTPPGAGGHIPEKLAEANLERLLKMAGVTPTAYKTMASGLKAPFKVPRPGQTPIESVVPRPNKVLSAARRADATPKPAGGGGSVPTEIAGKSLAKTGSVPDALKPKTAEAQELFTKNLERLGIKVAEDAINKAHISAGPAEAPKATEAGQDGGEPVGGAPKGPTSLIGSNEAAINFTRGQAYANKKEDMKKWLTEPMDSAAHDNTLQVAFDHTREAGPKVASDQTKTAAARALFQKLVEEVN